MKKKILSVLLTLCMAVSLMPVVTLPATAATAAEDDDIFSALQLDLTPPEGYDEDSTENPYGREIVASNEVFEPVMLSLGGFSISGHNGSADAASVAAAGRGTASGFGAQSGYLAMAAGDFNGDGLPGELAYVGITGVEANNLRLWLADSSGATHSAITLGSIDYLPTSMTYDAAYCVNHLKIATGDFDGDGRAEIAVLNASQESRSVEIYKLRINSDSGRDSWKNASEWICVWTHPISGNMFSLQAGDFDRDGVDDLAIASGAALYNKTNSHAYMATSYMSASDVKLLFGGNQGDMFRRSQSLELGENVIRAALTYGDYDGDGVKDLLVGAQPSSDSASNRQRYIAAYVWDGTQVALAASQIIRPVDGEYIEGVWSSSNGFDGDYLCLPWMNTNLAVVTPKVGGDTFVYIDSLLVNTRGGVFELERCLDEEEGWSELHTEYGAAAADTNGDGSQVLICGLYGVDNILTWHELEKESRLVFLGVPDANSKDIWMREKVEGTEAFCFANTDSDTVLLRYTGVHYLTYSEPEVLTVLASAPYFEDVAAMDPSYLELGGHETAYAQTSGQGRSIITTAGFSAGVKLAINYHGFIFETTAVATYDWEREHNVTTEYELNYSTAAGEDAVVLYSIPTEFYSYEVLIPNGMGGYDSQYTTVSTTYSPCVQVLSMDYYESVAKNYDALPQLAGRAVTHTVGDPASYPSDAAGYDVLAHNSESRMNGVSFGGGAISETVTVTEESSVSHVFGGAVDFSIGAGFKKYFQLTAETSVYAGGGYANIDMTGAAYSGTVANMPETLRDFGYYYSWKLFSYSYSYADKDGKEHTVPVVSYLVKDVAAPPSLPSDFSQRNAGTTAESIMLDWTYSGAVNAFYLYRYFDYPEGGGVYLVGVVEGSDYQVRYVDGKPVKYYAFEDTGLGPYTEYQYQIQVERSGTPPRSGMSAPLTARTRPTAGYPVLTLSDTELLIYPDKPAYLTALIANPGDFVNNRADYQWQKLTGGVWTDIPAGTDKTYTFASAGAADQGLYRCRVNVTSKAGNYAISAYTDEASVSYSKRSVMMDAPVVTERLSGQTLTLDVRNAHADSGAIPSGTVSFTLVSQDNVYYGYVAELDASGRASVRMEDFPDGAYTINASYSGSRIFKSMSSPEGYFLNNVTQSYAIAMDSSAEYGDTVSFRVSRLVQNTDGSVSLEPVESVAGIELLKDGKPIHPLLMGDYEIWYENGAGSFCAYNVGAYTLRIYAEEGGQVSASANVSVGKRALTIRFPSGSAFIGDYVYSSYELLYDDNVKPVPERLKQELRGDVRWGFFDSVGRLISGTLTTPGQYTTGLHWIVRDAELRAKYNFSFIEGSFVLSGDAQPLTLRMRQFDGLYTGQVAVVSPYRAVVGGGTDAGGEHNGRVAAGTRLLFNAIPDDGYEIEDWYINGEPQNNAARSLAHTMLNENTVVEVQFVIRRNSLTYGASGPGGTVTCEQGTESGSYVKAGANLRFLAEADEGYHFVQWRYTADGTTTYPEGFAGSGGRALELTMPSSSIAVYAAFARDSYTVTLGDGLCASYTGDHDGNAATPDREIGIASGDVIPGGTQITVRAATGYKPVEGAAWVAAAADDLRVSPDGASCSFTLTRDTSVQMPTERETFTVTLAFSAGAPDGESVISYVIDGGETRRFVKNGDDTLDISIPGGASLLAEAEFPAEYRFEGWSGVAAEISDQAQFSLLETAEGFTLTAMIVEKDCFSITLGDIPAALEGAVWQTSLNGDAFAASQGSVISVHRGDALSVRLFGLPSGALVGYWMVDGQSFQSTGTYTFTDIEADHTITPVSASTTYHTISWPDISPEQSGVTLKPESGSLSLVSSGGSFSFRLTALPGLTVDRVYAENAAGAKTELTAQNGIYTISNIRSNMAVVLTIQDIGLMVDGIDIGTLKGLGWRYYPQTRELRIIAARHVLSGIVDVGDDRTLAAPRVVAGPGVDSLILENLTLAGALSHGDYLVSAAGSCELILRGNNTLKVTDCWNKSDAGLIYSGGDIYLGGSGTLNGSSQYTMAERFCGISAMSVTLDGPKLSFDLFNDPWALNWTIGLNARSGDIIVDSGSADLCVSQSNYICGARVPGELAVNGGRLSVILGSGEPGSSVYGSYGVWSDELDVTVNGGSLNVTSVDKSAAYGLFSNKKTLYYTSGLISKQMPTGEINLGSGEINVDTGTSVAVGDIYLTGGSMSLYGRAAEPELRMVQTSSSIIFVSGDSPLRAERRTPTSQSGDRFQYSEINQLQKYIRAYPDPGSVSQVEVGVMNADGTMLEQYQPVATPGASSEFWKYESDSSAKKTLILYTAAYDFKDGEGNYLDLGDGLVFCLRGTDNALDIVSGGNKAFGTGSDDDTPASWLAARVVIEGLCVRSLRSDTADVNCGLDEFGVDKYRPGSAISVLEVKGYNQLIGGSEQSALLLKENAVITGPGVLSVQSKEAPALEKSVSVSCGELVLSGTPVDNYTKYCCIASGQSVIFKEADYTAYVDPASALSGGIINDTASGVRLMKKSVPGSISPASLRFDVADGEDTLPTAIVTPPKFSGDYKDIGSVTLDGEDVNGWLTGPDDDGSYTLRPVTADVTAGYHIATVGFEGGESVSLELFVTDDRPAAGVLVELEGAAGYRGEILALTANVRTMQSDYELKWEIEEQNTLSSIVSTAKDSAALSLAVYEPNERLAIRVYADGHPDTGGTAYISVATAVTGVVITGPNAVAPGESADYTASVLPEGELAPEQEVTWRLLDNTRTATELTINSDSSATLLLAGDETGTNGKLRLIAVSNATPVHSITMEIAVIRSGTPPTILTKSLPDGVMGAAYTGQISATDEGASFAVISGEVPRGLILSATGLISGTPTNLGEYGFTVRAENAHGADERSYVVRISMPPEVDAEPIGSVALVITPPVAGAVPQTAIDDDGLYTAGAAEWSNAPSIFDYDTDYSVAITLTARAGHVFTAATAATVNGKSASAALDGDGKLIVGMDFVTTSPIPLPSERTQTPVASVAGGTYAAPKTVALTCATEDAKIWYTLDGREPEAGSTLYIDPIEVDADMTVRALAKKEGLDDSEILTEEYRIRIPIVEAVRVTPEMTAVERGAAQSFAAEVSGQNDPSPAVVWSVSGTEALAPGTVVSATGLLIVGWQEANFELTVTASSVLDENVEGQALITVTEPEAQPPIITTAFLPAGRVSAAYVRTLTATGTAPITWSAEGLPLWMTLSDGVLSGTPLAAGSYEIKLTAVNAGGSDEARLTLTVTEKPTYNLTVRGGTGGGSYEAGAFVDISADAPANGQEFTGWSIVPELTNIVDAGASDTVIIMPAAAVIATANYRATGGGNGPGGGGGGGAVDGGAQPPKSDNTILIVDGVEYAIGIETVTYTTTVATAEQEKLESYIRKASDGSSVVVLISENITTTASLTLKNLADMAAKGMTLSLCSGGISYEIPAARLDVDGMLAQLGAADPRGVELNVTVTKLGAGSVSVRNGTLVLPAMEFSVTADYGGKKVEVKEFGVYVPRTIEVTAAQAAQITTAIVIEGGSQRHVPTNVYQQNGNWYVCINSLTNSTYALISNEVRFTDDDGKWFEVVVTEMASRGIISGRGTGILDGDANITRAEFAAILVRALGLPETGDASTFADVARTAWYYGAVGKAYEYGLINGRGEGIFDPLANITRQEAMAMVHSAAKITELAGSTGSLEAFSDADSISGWAQDVAKWNVGSGLIQGKGNGMICGQDNITRGETANIILRLLQLSKLVDVRTKA